MLDSNGCNTTAAAAVAKLSAGRNLNGKKAVVLAGTGPVGQRAAVMLAKEGATVAITSRKMEQAVKACAAMEDRFGVELMPIEAPDSISRAVAITDANIVLATGSAGIELISEDQWRDNPTIELMADANTTPPLGIGGTDMMDKGADRHGKLIWGAIGFGAYKLLLHRACIAKLFEDNKLVLDAEEIYALAKEMA
jgi:threonine dehydrogenase-like Zn-dependent dehydrogenase